MALTYTQPFPQTIVTQTTILNNASGTTITSVYPVQTNGAVVGSINISNTDTNPYTVNIYVVKSAVNYLLATISIPASAGNTTAAPSVELINGQTNIPGLVKDAFGNTKLYIDSSTSIAIGVTSTITSPKQLSVVVSSAIF